MKKLALAVTLALSAPAFADDASVCWALASATQSNNGLSPEANAAAVAAVCRSQGIDTALRYQDALRNDRATYGPVIIQGQGATGAQQLPGYVGPAANPGAVCSRFNQNGQYIGYSLGPCR